MKSKIDIQNIKKHLDVHFFGPLMVLEKIHLSKGAKVIFFCDAGVIQPKKNHFGYSFSKSLLQEFIRHLAVEFAPHIRIVGIGLGPIISDKKGTSKKAFNQKALITITNPALGLINLIRFIIHEENIFISGQIIPFDGGAYIKR